MNTKKTGTELEEQRLILTFLVILAAFALMISGIYTARIELCGLVWLILMAAMFSTPLRRRMLAGFIKNKHNGK